VEGWIGGGWVYEAYEVKNNREKLRCLLLRRKKKLLFYIYDVIVKQNFDERCSIHYSSAGGGESTSVHMDE
jgi:hypothetical protein